MDTKSNITPSFGGVIGAKSSMTQIDMLDLKAIVNTHYFKLFVSNNDNDLQKYHLADNQFIWTGGLALGKDFQIKNFNQHKADHKFVYLTFSETKLQIYTDHYSKIPLLYLQDNETLYFASSLELLLKIADKKPAQFNKDGLLFYYNFGFSAFNHTLVEGVKSLSGGQLLSFENGDIKHNTYFNVFDIEQYTRNNAFLESNINAIDASLLKSTDEVLQSYKNIGIALSGGVDSGYLAQKINECGKSFNAYTIGFEDDYNEFERIDYLSKKLNFTTKKIILNPNDIITNYLEVSKYSSFPVGFNNSILNTIYENASSDGVDILFDGDGADRLFLGMNKYLQLQKILQLYNTTKSLKLNGLTAKVLTMIKHPSAGKLSFYFKKFNENYPFYGERKLSGSAIYDKEFEELLNNLALPEELKQLSTSSDKWLFFSLFSVYYTPTFFFHTPYELQLRHNIVSNPQFWSDDLVKLGLSIPVRQKLHKSTTKMVLREAAKLKIDDGYWNLSKIGLQNSYEYVKKSDMGKAFISSYVDLIKKSDEYQYLKEISPEHTIEAERLLPYWIWKESFMSS